MSIIPFEKEFIVSNIQSLNLSCFLIILKLNIRTLPGVLINDPQQFPGLYAFKSATNYNIQYLNFILNVK